MKIEVPVQNYSVPILPIVLGAAVAGKYRLAGRSDGESINISARDNETGAIVVSGGGGGAVVR